MEPELFENLFYEWLESADVTLPDVNVVSDESSGTIAFNLYGVEVEYEVDWSIGRSYVTIEDVNLYEVGHDPEELRDILDSIIDIGYQLDKIYSM